jgi:hypothetical protein
MNHVAANLLARGSSSLMPLARGESGMRALFVGGQRTDALSVPELRREVVVYVEAQGVLRADDKSGLTGIRYRLVEPVGPEMPVYVCT